AARRGPAATAVAAGLALPGGPAPVAPRPGPGPGGDRRAGRTPRPPALPHPLPHRLLPRRPPPRGASPLAPAAAPVAAAPPEPSQRPVVSRRGAGHPGPELVPA